MAPLLLADIPFSHALLQSAVPAVLLVLAWCCCAKRPGCATSPTIASASSKSSGRGKAP